MGLSELTAVHSGYVFVISHLSPLQHAHKKIAEQLQLLIIFGCPASCIKLQATPSVSPSPLCTSLCQHY